MNKLMTRFSSVRLLAYLPLLAGTAACDYRRIEFPSMYDKPLLWEWIEPRQGAREVPLDVVVRAQFDEPIAQQQQPIAFAEQNPLTPYNPSSIPFEMEWQERTVALRPVSPLQSDRRYDVIFTKGLTSSEGHHLSSELWTFFYTIDLKPPEVVFTRPADGAVAVAADALVEVVFSEDVKPQGVYLRRIDGGEGIQCAPGPASPASCESSWEEGHVMTFRPRDQWPAGALLEVEVSVYVTDLAGRQIVSPYFARFSIAN